MFTAFPYANNRISRYSASITESKRINIGLLELCRHMEPPSLFLLVLNVPHQLLDIIIHKFSHYISNLIPDSSLSLPLPFTIQPICDLISGCNIVNDYPPVYKYRLLVVHRTTRSGPSLWEAQTARLAAHYSPKMPAILASSERSHQLHRQRRP